MEKERPNAYGIGYVEHKMSIQMFQYNLCINCIAHLIY